MCWPVIWRIIFFLLSVSSFLFILGRGGCSDRSSVRRKQKSHLDATEASPAWNGLVQGCTAYVYLGTSFFPGQAVWLLLPCRLFVRVSQSYLWFSFFSFFKLRWGNRVYWNVWSGLLNNIGDCLEIECFIWQCISHQISLFFERRLLDSSYGTSWGRASLSNFIAVALQTSLV